MRKSFKYIFGTILVIIGTPAFVGAEDKPAASTMEITETAAISVKPMKRVMTAIRKDIASATQSRLEPKAWTMWVRISTRPLMRALTELAV